LGKLKYDVVNMYLVSVGLLITISERAITAMESPLFLALAHSAVLQNKVAIIGVRED